MKSRDEKQSDCPSSSGETWVLGTESPCQEKTENPFRKEKDKYRCVEVEVEVETPN